MRILVAIKQVITPDLPLELFEVDPVGLRQRPDDHPLVASAYDEHALEVALQLRDRYGAMVTVATAGPDSAARVLRKALAMGADEALRIDLDGADDRDPEVVAAALAAVARRQETSLVLCGCHSADWGWEQTGPLVAAILGWPCVTFATAVEVAADSLLVARPLRDGHERLRVRGQAVVTIASSAGNAPRLAHVRAVLQAERRPIALLPVSELLAESPPRPSPRLVGLRVPPPRAACVMAEGDAPADRAHALVQLLRERRLLP